MPPCPADNKVNQLGSRPQEVKVSASALYMSMSLDGYIAGPNDEPGNPPATASTGCTSGSSLRMGSSAGRPGRADNCGKCTRPGPCWRGGGPWRRAITGGGVVMVGRSLWPVNRPP